MERLGSEDPRWIGDYRLLRRLGEGGMGRVYLARSRRGRTVAVKVVQSTLARQPDFRKRFALEIAAARRVGGEWTAPVLDADTETELPWVATGYIAGPSLAEVVSEQYGRLPERSVHALASGLVEALRAIHGAGLIHRDLKPSNILLTIDGPRVIDFGIARALDSAVQSAGGLTNTGALVGSPGFMSPEQVRGQQVTPASDVFCLGAVLAYAATGRMPFGTADSGIHALLFRIVAEEPDLGGLPTQLHGLISACLSKEPSERPDVAALTEATSGDARGTWLPGEVLAQLGRHAVQLLDSEDPEGGTSGGMPGLADAAMSARTGPHASAGSGSGAAPAAGAPYVPSGVYGPPADTSFTHHHPQQTPPQGPYAFGSGPGSGPVHQATPLRDPRAPAPVPEPVPEPVSAAASEPAPAAGSAADAPTALGLSAARPTRLLIMLMGVFVAWSLAQLSLHISVQGAINSARGGLESFETITVSELSGYSRLKLLTSLLSGAGSILGIALVVLWLRWFRAVRATAETLAPGQIRYASGMAVGSWFIPLLNYVLPKLILNDIWKAGAPPEDKPAPEKADRIGSVLLWLRTRRITDLWWALWIVYFTVRLSNSDKSWYGDGEYVYSGANNVDIFVDLISLPLGCLAIAVIVRLNATQRRRLAERC